MIQAASTAWRETFRSARGALAPLLLVAASAATAQPSAPAVIEVQAGDTFSGIAPADVLRLLQGVAQGNGVVEITLHDLYTVLRRER